MDSHDSGTAEHPSNFNATVAATGSMEQLNDIGLIIKLRMSADDAARVVNTLSCGESISW